MDRMEARMSEMEALLKEISENQAILLSRLDTRESYRCCVNMVRVPAVTEAVVLPNSSVPVNRDHNVVAPDILKVQTIDGLHSLWEELIRTATKSSKTFKRRQALIQLVTKYATTKGMTEADAACHLELVRKNNGKSINTCCESQAKLQMFLSLVAEVDGMREQQLNDGESQTYTLQ